MYFCGIVTRFIEFGIVISSVWSNLTFMKEKIIIKNSPVENSFKSPVITDFIILLTEN